MLYPRFVLYYKIDFESQRLFQWPVLGTGCEIPRTRYQTEARLTRKRPIGWSNKL